MNQSVVQLPLGEQSASPATEKAAEIVLIDLSSIAYPIWHTNSKDPDPDKTSQLSVARVLALATGHPHAAVCCDSGRGSFRRELSASYKANRPEHDATLQHQITMAKEQLVAEGFPVWSVKGFEADDLIATATAKALAIDGLNVLVVSGDKDLLQLVGPRVQAIWATDGSRIDIKGVVLKFGVGPAQVRDYLTLVGDAADNIKGVAGIGPKTAVDLLTKYLTVDGIYEALAKSPTSFKPAAVTALKAFAPSLSLTRALVTLRTDVDLPFDEVYRERVSKAAAEFAPFVIDEVELSQPTAERATSAEGAARNDAAQGQVTDLPGSGAPSADVPSASRLNSPPSTALALREGEVLLAPAEWERQLDPRSMKDARILAKDMHDSRMFSAYGSPQGVLSTVMVGRELGLPAMASLRCIYNIEGKHSLSASLMVALVLRSGLAEFFEPISFSETEATYETKRKGARNAVKLTHTFEMARKAWPKSKKDWEESFNASGWGRNPTDMLVARATARLARMIYPDLLAGLYTPEELEEIRLQVAA